MRNATLMILCTSLAVAACSDDDPSNAIERDAAAPNNTTADAAPDSTMSGGDGGTEWTDATNTPDAGAGDVDPGPALYIVSPTYAGMLDIGDLRVLIYDDSVVCAGLNPDATTPMTIGTGIAATDGTLPTIVVPNLEPGSSYTVYVRAYDRADAQSEIAAGCADSSPPATAGMSVTVTVPLSDI